MAHIGIDLHRNSFAVRRPEEDSSGGAEVSGPRPADLGRFRMGPAADGEIAVEAAGNIARFRGEAVSRLGRAAKVHAGERR